MTVTIGTVASQWVDVTGGDNGILGVWPSAWAAKPWAFYELALVVAVCGVALLRLATFAPFGFMLRAVRDSELRAEVKQGNPSDYYVTSAGKRVAAAASSLPEAAVTCAAAKKMPNPETPASSCTGQRFKVVVAHSGDRRIALLYGQNGGSWHFCSAGTF